MQPASRMSSEPAPVTPAAKPVATTQSVAQAAPMAPPVAVDEKVTFDPMASLDRMGAFLRSLPAFALEAQTTKDEVLESGQKIQFQKTVQFRIRRPNFLRADVTSVDQDRSFYYDGKSFTLFARKLGYYATIEAPPTLRELHGMLDERYGVELPLADLFLFGTEDTSADEITSASYIGPSEILGLYTDHYAYRQNDIDWQLWIERGNQPLPRKLLIVTKELAAEPEYSAVLKWNLHPVLVDADFSFVPPTGAHRIEFTPKKKSAK